MMAGTQQRFVPANGACVAKTNLRPFSRYVNDTGRLATISDRIEMLDGFIPGSFFEPLSLDKDSPLRWITPYTIMAPMPRIGDPTAPALVHIGRQASGSKIVGISIPDLKNTCSLYCQLAKHFLFAHLKQLNAEHLANRILTPEALDEVKLFSMELSTMTVSPVDIPAPEDEGEEEGIQGLEAIDNPFAPTKFADTDTVHEIGSQASRQATAKASALKPAQKFSPNGAPTKSAQQQQDEQTVRTEKKKMLVQTVQEFKRLDFQMDSFLAALNKKTADTLQRCMAHEDPAVWKVSRSLVEPLTELLQTAMKRKEDNPEGKEVEMEDDQSAISNMTEFTDLSGASEAMEEEDNGKEDDSQQEDEEMEPAGEEEGKMEFDLTGAENLRASEESEGKRGEEDTHEAQPETGEGPKGEGNPPRDPSMPHTQPTAPTPATTEAWKEEEARGEHATSSAAASEPSTPNKKPSIPEVTPDKKEQPTSLAAAAAKATGTPESKSSDPNAGTDEDRRDSANSTNATKAGVDGAETPARRCPVDLPETAAAGIEVEGQPPADPTSGKPTPRSPETAAAGTPAVETRQENDAETVASAGTSVYTNMGGLGSVAAPQVATNSTPTIPQNGEEQEGAMADGREEADSDNISTTTSVYTNFDDLSSAMPEGEQEANKQSNQDFGQAGEQ